MRIVILPCLLLLASSAQAAKPLDCRSVFVGKWAANGIVPAMLNSEVDNKYEFKADGSFITYASTRSSADAAWEDHEHRGTWTARRGSQRDACILVQTIASGFLREASGKRTPFYENQISSGIEVTVSPSEQEQAYRVIDNDTLDLGGTRLRRLPAAAAIAARPVAASKADCTATLAGNWSGSRKEDDAEIRVQVKFQRDGKFTEHTHIRAASEPARTHESKGTWRAAATTTEAVCQVHMDEAGKEKDSRFPELPNYYRVVDKDTLSTHGIRLTRAR